MKCTYVVSAKPHRQFDTDGRLFRAKRSISPTETGFYMPSAIATRNMPPSTLPTNPATEADAEAEKILVHSPVLDRLEEFFSDPSVTSAINDFCCAHASITPLAEGAEHPLEYHTAFLEYAKLIEDQVAAFMAEHGFSEEDIVIAALHAPPGVHTCIDYLLASTEYTAFLQLMGQFNSLADAVDDTNDYKDS